MTNTGQRTAEFLAVCVENAELRQQLAEVQEQCVELAVDAGAMHAENMEIRTRLAEAERERDAWRAEAERISGQVDQKTLRGRTGPASRPHMQATAYPSR